MWLPSRARLTKLSLQEDGRSGAPHASSRHDDDSITQDISLLHEVCGEQYGTVAFLNLQSASSNSRDKTIEVRIPGGDPKCLAWPPDPCQRLARPT